MAKKKRAISYLLFQVLSRISELTSSPTVHLILYYVIQYKKCSFNGHNFVAGGNLCRDISTLFLPDHTLHHTLPGREVNTPCTHNIIPTCQNLGRASDPFFKLIEDIGQTLLVIHRHLCEVHCTSMRVQVLEHSRQRHTLDWNAI